MFESQLTRQQVSIQLVLLGALFGYAAGIAITYVPLDPFGFAPGILTTVPVAYIHAVGAAVSVLFGLGFVAVYRTQLRDAVAPSPTSA